MYEPDDTRSVKLTKDERTLLLRALTVWTEPDLGTEQLALAMGYSDLTELRTRSAAIVVELKANRPLSPVDWTRALLAAEIGFASDVLGHGLSWESVTRLDDATSLRTLRQVQGKLADVRSQARPVSDSSHSKAVASTLPDTDVARVRRWCERRVPAANRDELRVEAIVEARWITIVERRPPWDGQSIDEWLDVPVARLRYTKATGQWALYYTDRHSRFHLYDYAQPSPNVESLLKEIERDPTSIFWG